MNHPNQNDQLKNIVTNEQIEKPINDERLYESFTLKNNDLQVLLISDKNTEKSAAARGACGT